MLCSNSGKIGLEFNYGSSDESSSTTQLVQFNQAQTRIRNDKANSCFVVDCDKLGITKVRGGGAIFGQTGKVAVKASSGSTIYLYFDKGLLTKVSTDNDATYNYLH
jgi:hypothetical protein